MDTIQCAASISHSRIRTMQTILTSTSTSDIILLSVPQTWVSRMVELTFSDRPMVPQNHLDIHNTRAWSTGNHLLSTRSLSTIIMIRMKLQELLCACTASVKLLSGPLSLAPSLISLTQAVARKLSSSSRLQASPTTRLSILMLMGWRCKSES
jgi:hypothetical protein